jgi:hypothetical protein
MLSLWIIGGLIAAAAVTGEIAGYAASKRRGYYWQIGYDPYWRRSV